VESSRWFKGIALIVFLVVGGVEVKPGPPTEQETSDHILKQIINRHRESRMSKKLFETNNRQICDLRSVFTEFEVNLEGLSE
jgi:hypothetical protein